MSSALFLLTTSTKSSGSSFLLPVLLLGFVAIYFFVLRPKQKAAQAQRTQNSNVEVGDEVITIGGVRGVVISVDDETVTLATGLIPGDQGNSGGATHITFIKKAIGQKVTPPAPETPSTSPDPAAPEADGGASDPEAS